jgi:uncharacterized protein
MDDTLGRLFESVRADHRDAVAQALAADSSLLEARNDAGDSLLLAAIYAGAWHIVELLLARGARHDVFTAAAIGDVALLPTFLEADPGAARAVAHDGWTALHLAAFFGHPDAVRHLIEGGADVHTRSHNPTANEPLHAAAVRGHDDVVQLLLAHGADVNAVAGGGYTPLMLAAAGGHAAVAERLLTHGADPARVDAAGVTAHAHAAQRGHAALAERLARTGAPGPPSEPG